MAGDRRPGRRQHAGVDLAAPTGTPVYATADGIVSRADWFSSYGLYISIEHGASMQTRFGHLSRLAVAAGDNVKKGDLIARLDASDVLASLSARVARSCAAALVLDSCSFLSAAAFGPLPSRPRPPVQDVLEDLLGRVGVAGGGTAQGAYGGGHRGDATDPGPLPRPAFDRRSRRRSAATAARRP